MICIRIALNAQGGTGERAAHLEGHKAFLRSGRLRILHSGPFFGSGGRQVGALVVADVSGPAAMEAICKEDPFIAHGVYCQDTYAEWRITLGQALASGAVG
jgi:uncharacterized protein